jgi:hypothetical protein
MLSDLAHALSMHSLPHSFARAPLPPPPHHHPYLMPHTKLAADVRPPPPPPHAPMQASAPPWSPILTLGCEAS